MGSCKAEAWCHRPRVHRRQCCQATLMAPTGWAPLRPGEAPGWAWPPPSPGLGDGDAGPAIRGLCSQHHHKFNPLQPEGRKVLQLKRKVYFLSYLLNVPAECSQRGTARQRPQAGPARRSRQVRVRQCGAVPPRRLNGGWGAPPICHLLANTPHQYTGLAKSHTVSANPAMFPLCLLFSLGRLLSRRGKVQTQYPTQVQAWLETIVLFG